MLINFIVKCYQRHLLTKSVKRHHDQHLSVCLF